jgi:predicted PurR-regulated permease PerM
MAERSPVPVRLILAVIGLVVLSGMALLAVLALGRVLAWIVVAGFFTIILNPAVDALTRRARMRRGLATFVVFIAGTALLAGMIYAFVRPIVDQVSEFIDDLPGYVEDAQEGRGWIGRQVEKYELQDYLEENQDRIQEQVTNLGTPALDIVQQVFSTLVALITILVLTFLMLLQAPGITKHATLMVPADHRERVRSVARDASRAVSGYMLGNLLISLIAGTATYVYLRIVGVPYPEVLALWVAFTDLIPLIGATLGAVLVVAVSFLTSVGVGIATLVFFVVYQQFENHVLQVTVMSRTVDVNPLAVLVSILMGVELFGILGALLAIPVAGVIQVVVRDVYDSERGGLKPHPTVGTSETPHHAAEEA